MASEGIKKLFQGVDVLVSGDQKEHSLDAVLSNKKYVLLYFSAHWCPPCRGFTPVLKQFHADKSAELGFEVVFVSSDRDEKSFYEYLSKSHGAWYALPFDQSEAQSQISETFGVEGIPTLVVLDAATGEKITDAGVEELSSDTSGAKFPWRGKGLWELLGDTLVDNKGNEFPLQDRLKQTEAFALYFSAHWCPPCRGFTPQLVKTYLHLRDVAKKPFEIIFVSSDRDAKSFDEYFGEMPWLTLKAPSEEEKGSRHPSKAGLSRLFEVQGIPSLVILDPSDGHVINASGRSAVSGDPEGEEFPWRPRPVADLGKGADGIDKGASLVVFLEGAPKGAAALVRDVVEPLAVQHKSDTFRFFFNADEGCYVAHRLREIAKLGYAREVDNGAGVNAHAGINGRWYCGREGIVKCECGNCDGTCGPSNGCACDDCKKLETEPPAPLENDDSSKIRVVIFELRKQRYFSFDSFAGPDNKTLNKENLEAFIAAFKDNKLTASH